MLYCVQCAQYAQLLPSGLAQPCPARQTGYVMGKMPKERRHRFEKGKHPRTGRDEVVLEAWALRDLSFLTQGCEVRA